MQSIRSRSIVVALVAMFIVAACSSNAATATPPTPAPTIAPTPTSVAPTAAQTTAAVTPTPAASVAAAGFTPLGPTALAGKKVLVVPYWLDQFNTANTSWISRLLTQEGASKVDVINPDKSASRQLDIIETAISSKQYDAIAWQPIDETVAPSTIKKIQDAGISQVVAFSSLVPGTNGLNFSAAVVKWDKTYFDAGVAAAKFLAQHPDLGPARIAYANIYPPETKCDALLQSLVDGVKSVSSDVQVVYNQGAQSGAEATSKLTDFITRKIKFNIYAGCGTTFDMGGFAALQAAGLSKATAGPNGATDKVPQSVYAVSLDASVPELTQLWASDSSMMNSVMFGPKSAAEAVVKEINDQLTGVTKYSDASSMVAALLTLNSDCQTGRASVLEQFQGVQGFTVPACS